MKLICALSLSLPAILYGVPTTARAESVPDTFVLPEAQSAEAYRVSIARVFGDDYGLKLWKGRRASPERLRFWPEADRGRVTVRGVARETWRWLGRLRPFILGAILVTIWPAADPMLVEPPAFLSGAPERVNATFPLCGRTRSRTCVVDGDTFRLGGRRIRIVGIDAPETHPPRCAEEARLGRLATLELQRLLNAGPFEMTARLDEPRDRYGRELRSLRRATADGGTVSIADQMRESRLARRYLGGFRGGWC